MPNHKGNTDNLKWTPEEINKVLQLVSDYLTDDPEGKKCLYISTALSDVGDRFGYKLYHEIWSYWQKVLQEPIGCKLEDESNETKSFRLEVFNTIKSLDDKIEGRMVAKTLAMKASAPMAIFILKQKGWSDQKQLDITSKDEKINSFDGKMSVTVLNSNDKIKFDESGKIVEDTTGEGLDD